MKKYEFTDHEPSFLPEGNWKLVWNDEFDGDKLDTSKWDYRLCMMGKKHDAWTDKGVKIADSNAIFTIFEENGHIVSSQLQTGYNFMDQPVENTKFLDSFLQWPIGKLKENKFQHRYGFYECRCKLQKTDGWWSAFWLQSPVIGCSLDPAQAGIEVDIMECFDPPVVVPQNLIWGGYGQDTQVKRTGGKPDLNPDDYHYFAVDWSEDGYVFYIDGEETGRQSEPVSKIDQFILISTEVKGYRDETKKPRAEAFNSVAIGDTFAVDHVRVFVRE